MSFLQLLHTELQEKWTFENELPIQTKMIPAMLEGKDIIAISPTGSGKTLAYVLPLLQLVDPKKKATQALIVAPSQELSMQIIDVIKQWSQGLGITSAQLIGGANIERQIDHLKKKPSIVVGTPGRLIELIKRKKLKMHEIQHLVLDECDHLLNREHRSLVKEILDSAQHDVQKVLVSATITEEIELTASRIMQDPVHITVGAEEMPTSGEVIHSFIKVDDIREKTELLRKLAHVEGLKALAFVNTIDDILMKTIKLQYHHAQIVALHSEMKKEERKKAIHDFKKGNVKILIATEVAARGLDIEGITHVIHVDLPRTKEQFLHRSGRTGRAGRNGEVLTFLTVADEKHYKNFIRELSLRPVEKILKNGQLVEKTHKKVERSFKNGERK